MGPAAVPRQAEEELDLVRLDDEVVRLGPAYLGGSEADAIVAEGERVRGRAPLPGWPAATRCGCASLVPVLGPHDEALGIAQPGGVEHAHSCMMPDAVTPTERRTSPETDDSGRFPLAERLTPSSQVPSEIERDDDVVDDRPRQVGVHGAVEPEGTGTRCLGDRDYLPLRVGRITCGPAGRSGLSASV